MSHVVLLMLFDRGERDEDKAPLAGAWGPVFECREGPGMRMPDGDGVALFGRPFFGERQLSSDVVFGGFVIEKDIAR